MNNSINIRFCVIKIQEIDGQLSKVENINYNIGIYIRKSHNLSTSCACDKCVARMRTTCEIQLFYKAPASL